MRGSIPEQEIKCEAWIERVESAVNNWARETFVVKFAFTCNRPYLVSVEGSLLIAQANEAQFLDSKSPNLVLPNSSFDLKKRKDVEPIPKEFFVLHRSRSIAPRITGTLTLKRKDATQFIYTADVDIAVS